MDISCVLLNDVTSHAQQFCWSPGFQKNVWVCF